MTRGTFGRLAGIGAVLMIALSMGCTAASPPHTAEYEMGYWDGCNTGYAEAGRPGYEAAAYKNLQRFATDEEYRHGWEDGEHVCYDREVRFPTVPFGVWGR